MKKIILAIVAPIFSIAAHAQIFQPVHWSYGAKKISSSEAVVFIKATIDDDWHIYSQTVKDGGPIKTTFTFEPSSEYRLSGSTTEPTPRTRFEKSFNMDVSYFEHSVIFQQKIKLKAKETVVKGTLEYMTCNEQRCLPPDDITFNIPVK